MRESQESELVRRMLAGDEDAYDDFAEEYFAAVYRFAQSRARGDRELTRDIVQTTLTKAMEKLSTFRGESSVLTWLCTICRNEIAMHFRSARHRVEVAGREDDALEQAALPLHSAPDGPEWSLLRDEQSLLVHMTLDQLSDRHRTALVWKYVEDTPVSQIGDRLGVGEKAAESLLTRARVAFRKAYERVQRDASQPPTRLRALEVSP